MPVARDSQGQEQREVPGPVRTKNCPLPCRDSPEREQREITDLVWEQIPGFVWEQDRIEMHILYIWR